MKFTRHHIDNTSYEVWVIDDFVPGPERLIDYAVSLGAGDECANGYPGIRREAPSGYLQYAIRAVNAITARSHTLPNISSGKAYFSMVTKKPSALTREQRVPHFDRPYTQELAMVHYLCSPPHGGTSFYRHRASYRSAITTQHVQSYLQELESELANYQPEAKYMNGDNALFERVLQIPCRFNRAVIYPCALLHSGDIPTPFEPNLNPYQGRFTVTGFLK